MTPSVTALAKLQPGPHGWGKHHWFDHWRAEHEACRESVALIDMSFMSKFLVIPQLVWHLSESVVVGCDARTHWTRQNLCPVV